MIVFILFNIHFVNNKNSFINSQIEKHARIGAVIFSETPWTIENEILTPTMKIRREQIEMQFGEDAERLAREGAEAGSILMHWAK